MKPIACTDADYAELLGLYLGDGHIERAGRTWSLRLTFDTKYAAMNAEIVALMQRCFPANRVDRYENPPSTTIVRVCSSHLPCLFPQHGPGKKHERPISLEPWQRAVISRAPWALLRGLVRSDGCAFVNRFDRYELLSYDFANRSRDILDLFCDTCDAVGVRYRRYETRVRINRRESVALCEREIGLKR